MGSNKVAPKTRCGCLPGTSEASVYNKMGGEFATVTLLLGDVKRRCFMMRKECLNCGDILTEEAVPYWILLSMVVQHLPTFPNRVEHRKLNLPMILAEIVGVMYPDFCTASIVLSKPWSLVGLASTARTLWVVNDSVLKRTPRIATTSDGGCDFSLSRVKPKSWKVSLKQKAVTCIAVEGSTTKKSSKKWSTANLKHRAINLLNHSATLQKFGTACPAPKGWPYISWRSTSSEKGL